MAKRNIYFRSVFTTRQAMRLWNKGNVRHLQSVGAAVSNQPYLIHDSGNSLTLPRIGTTTNLQQNLFIAKNGWDEKCLRHAFFVGTQDKYKPWHIIQSITYSYVMPLTHYSIDYILICYAILISFVSYMSHMSHGIKNKILSNVDVWKFSCNHF